MKLIALLFPLLLVGCADTPENRALWLGIAGGMSSAGQALSQEAQQMRADQIRENSRQTEMMRPINCVTTYDALGRAFTSCTRY